MNSFSQSQRRAADGIRRRMVSKVGRKIPEAVTSPVTVETPPPPAAESEGGIIITEPSFPVENDRDAGVVFSQEDIVEPRSSRFVWWGIVSGITAVAVLGILLSTVFARLTVKIKPRVEEIALSGVSLAFDTSVSRPLLAQHVLPAEQLEFVRRAADEFDATGREFIEERARGKVQLYNSFSSSPQTLVASTRFVTGAGTIFRLPQNIVISGAKIEEGKIVPKFIEAELIADKAGDGSNISGEVPLKIPGFKGTAKYDGFYAVATSGFTGGFQGEARVISQDDLKRAQEVVTKKVHGELSQEVVRKIPSDFKLIEGLREIQITNIDSPKVKTRRDRFSVEAAARARVIVFRAEDVAALVKETLFKDDHSREFLAGKEKIEYHVRTADFSKKRAEVVIEGTVQARSLIPQGEFAGLISGKKEGSIIEFLKNRKEVADFSVSFFPPWLFSAPRNTAKINFKVQD